jgi:hypothetical protein
MAVPYADLATGAMGTGVEYRAEEKYSAIV